MLAASAVVPRILEKEPIVIEAVPAPAPLDAYWPNLLASRLWRRFYQWAAVSATVRGARNARNASSARNARNARNACLTLAWAVSSLPPIVSFQRCSIVSDLWQVALFLFWTIPVAFVQSIATLTNLARAAPFLDGLVNSIENAGPATVHFVQNTLSTWVLIGLRAATLNSGLFQWLARLGGAMRHSDIQARHHVTVM